MTSRKELIEEARAEAEATKNSYYTKAPLLFALADALEAAEKAHAPTDDEREADEKAILNALYDSREAFTGVGAEVGTDETAILVDHVPDIVLALGFRRSEVPEPQDDDRTHEFANMAAIMGIPEPQGEPSDAQVRAAVLAWRSMGGGRLGTPSMRVALRAALRTAGGAR